jgi:hypothetical protein
MTLAEIMLLIAGGVGIYFLLRPLQRWLETYFLRRFFARHSRLRRPMIDVTDFASHRTHKKEDDTHEHRA